MNYSLRRSGLIFLTLIALSCMFSVAVCDRPMQIRQLEDVIIGTKENHMLGNLRNHDGHSSVGNQLGGAIFGFIFGPIVFFMSFICIWFNQKRAVIDHRRLKLAEEICQDVNPLRREQITAANMKLTYISGNSTTNQTIGDRMSNITANGALKITRSVQVMEWRATTRENDGRKQVEYHLGWQSSNQPHVQGRPNPTQNWLLQNQIIYNEKVYIGQYLLSKSQAQQCSKAVQITPDMNNANTIASNIQIRRAQPHVSDGYIYFPSPLSNLISDHGALRIKYSYCPIGPISIMAKTVGNSFESFPIAQYEGNGKVQKNQLPACCCLSNCIAVLLKPIQQINLVEEQILTRSQMVKKTIQKSKLYTLLIRIGSFILMVLGICMFFSPITTILGFIPLVGGILKGTVGFVIFLAALLICIPFFIIAFSLAWLWYHPKVGIIFFGIGLLILGIILFINYSKKGDIQAAASTAQTVKHMMRSWSHSS